MKPIEFGLERTIRAPIRHRGKLVSYGVWRLGTPIWRRFAVKERTITVDALKASFE